MSEFWKKAIIRASIGFVLGILVGLGFLSITGVEKYLAEKGMDGLVLYLALSGLFAGALGPAALYGHPLCAYPLGLLRGGLYAGLARPAGSRDAVHVPRLCDCLLHHMAGYVSDLQAADSPDQRSAEDMEGASG